MSVSTKMENTIWGQFGGYCAICRKRLAQKSDLDDEIENGEVVHIIGNHTSECRYSEEVCDEYKNSEMNLMLLCTQHHNTIDDIQGEENFPVEKLHEIKDEHIAWVEDSLAKYESCDTNFSDFAYINIPRLNQLFLNYGKRVKLERYDEAKALYKHSWALKNILNKYKDLFSNTALDAIPLKNIKFIHEGYVGNVVFFENEQFHPKNIGVKNKKEYSHIYQDSFNGWRLVLYINQNWIATNKAMKSLMNEQIDELNGFFTIVNVEYTKNTIYGIPLAIGKGA
jgi:hypothetical protein